MVYCILNRKENDFQLDGQETIHSRDGIWDESKEKLEFTRKLVKEVNIGKKSQGQVKVKWPGCLSGP